MLVEEKKTHENVFKKAYKKIDYTERSIRENLGDILKASW